jgi:hypothetical protein
MSRVSKYTLIRSREEIGDLGLDMFWRVSPVFISTGQGQNRMKLT